MHLSELDDSLVALNTQMAAARDSEATELQQSLVQLQLWGVLTNARLALVDGELDAAKTAVIQAITLASHLTAEPESVAAQALLRLQTRLTLAADGFATDLDMVAQDLQAASNELNLLIAGPQTEEAAGETATPLPSEITPTAVPAPTATPSS